MGGVSEREQILLETGGVRQSSFTERRERERGGEVKGVLYIHSAFIENQYSVKENNCACLETAKKLTETFHFAFPYRETKHSKTT